LKIICTRAFGSQYSTNNNNIIANANVEVSETATTAATAAAAVFSPEDHKALAKISEAEDKLQDRRAKFKMDPSAYDTNYLSKYPKDELVSIIRMYES
jgi:hypothetical protein